MIRTGDDHGEKTVFREFLDQHPYCEAEAHGGYRGGAEVFRLKRNTASG